MLDHLAMKSGRRNFAFLFWACAVLVSCLVLFFNGFLLRRNVLEERATCNTKANCNGIPPVFKQAVVVIIDALKYDFAVYNESKRDPEHFENKLPILQQLCSGGHGRLFRFLADPPTATMQRLKGLTTGSLPTFVDVSSNFGSYEIDEDNLLDQLKAQGKRVVFTGDDTWMGLFPTQFNESHPFPSFDVWDLDTVDRGVTRHMYDKLALEPLQSPSDSSVDDWDVLIGHYLGVDHAGHKFGPRHPEMERKLREMNGVIEDIAQTLTKDQILLVLGDHGMTSSGGHGGDSDDELRAALFVYSPRFEFGRNGAILGQLEAEETVGQVDFVPTFAMLMGVPIPFSNLGRVIESLLPSSPPSLVLKYLVTNVEQVMTYLETYRIKGGNLPSSAYEKLREQFEEFQRQTTKTNDPAVLRQQSELAGRFLADAKSMCLSVWVDFDLNLMAAGLTLGLLQVSLLLALLQTPRNRLLAGVLSSKLVATLYVTTLAGAAVAGGFILALAPVWGLTKVQEKPLEIVLGLSSSFSVMTFGFLLLWCLRSSLAAVLMSLSRPLSAAPAIPVILYLAGLFSNSYVVEEARTLNFLCCSLVLGSMLWGCGALKRHLRLADADLPPSTSNKSPLCATTGALFLALLGVIRTGNVYFRCREEQQAYCEPTEFHQSIGTLSATEAYKAYKNWRFFSTLVAVFLFVWLPQKWMKDCGNLNGISLPVLLASYVPTTMGLCTISYWALQGHELGSKLVPWQQNILAQAVFVMAIVVTLVTLVQPRLVYLVARHKSGAQQDSGVSARDADGVRTYFDFMRSNWRTQLRNNSGVRDRIVVFGLGTALSAPLLLINCMVGFVSMLVLGDGQCPVVVIVAAAMLLFVYLTTRERIRDAETSSDLFRVPWSTVIGWWLLESLFFYASGHQPTFPSIQYNAAFAGFTGMNYGNTASDFGLGPAMNSMLGSLVNLVLPAVLIGWNTFVSRILFSLALPFLLVAPFALWLRCPSLRRPFAPALPTAATTTEPRPTGDEHGFEQGEVVVIERPEEAKAQLFNLCGKYLLLQTGRLVVTMVAAAVLRRHLMVWKIFAPRFLFEALGYLIAVGSLLLTYLVMIRLQNSLTAYYVKLEKEQ